MIADKDEAVEITLAVLIASALPLLNFGSEMHLWTDALQDIQGRVELRAEREWSVPSEIEVPAIDLGKPEPVKIPTKHGTLNLGALTKGLVAASGPVDSGEQAIEGANPNWPDSGQPWSQQFAPQAAKAIKAAVDEAVKHVSDQLTQTTS